MILAEKFYALKEITYLYRNSNKKIWNERKLIDQFNGFISLKDKIQFKNLENIIEQNEKKFKNNGIKSAYKTI